MNADRLLAYYEQIADAPDAIVRLRRFILDLAVRGKLVPQDPNDEPASELLKRIAAEKARRVSQGTLREQKPLPPIEHGEVEFELPQGWQWVRMAEVIKLWNGFAFKSGDFQAVGVPVIRIGDLQDGTVTLSGAACVSEAVAKSVATEVWVPPNALLIAMSGATTGKTAFNRTARPLLLNQRVGRIEVFSISVNFLRFFFETIIARNLSISFGTAIPNLSAQQINETVIPLPPLAEQHRIVAKVDELMALGDQLEAARTEREASRDRLAAASLARLNAPAPETFEEDARFALDALPALTTRPDQVKALRQTILNLAVRGKLVPQDPNDEPASELLKRIAEEKARLLETGEIKRDKTPSPIGEDDKPFTLPSSWGWCRLRSLATALGDGIHGTPEYTLGTGYHFINGNNLENGRIVIRPTTKTVSLSELKKHKKPLNEYTVLVSINGTLGNVAFYEGEEIMLGKSACYFNLTPFTNKPFVKIVLDSPYFSNYANDRATGTTIMNLSLNAVNEFPFPLPPLAEQQRIVAKVDELMALCDQLEVSLKNATSTRSRLLSALLVEALTPPETRELEPME